MKKFNHTLAMLILLAGIVSSFGCKKDTAPDSLQPAPADDRVNANAWVFPPTAHPYGQSYAEWTIDWWTLFLNSDCDHLPFGDGTHALFNQSGPVYFLGGLYPPGATATLTVPRGKALLFPMINFINDYPCPDPNFQPQPGQSLEEFLTQGAIAAMAPVTDLSVTIDGVPVSNPGQYLFTSSLFYFTGNAALSACADPCVTGESQPAVASGYYIMLKPLAPGQHTVHYTSNIPAFTFMQDGTYHITVE